MSFQNGRKWGFVIQFYKNPKPNLLLTDCRDQENIHTHRKRKWLHTCEEKKIETKRCLAARDHINCGPLQNNNDLR